MRRRSRSRPYSWRDLRVGVTFGVAVIVAVAVGFAVRLTLAKAEFFRGKRTG